MRAMVFHETNFFRRETHQPQLRDAVGAAALAVKIIDEAYGTKEATEGSFES